ncbi:unnamed protein product [Aspergillus oryzae var. brunneus]|uniref:Unnamed protein product n=2 Tax=Aspergillus oryzae TaxID=5062 RepID=A0AAN5BZU5_ASPOZ|nr:unnamed protein product [Aspergillus oryzae]GMG33519.1 unnamed protein product [Aspergillus oryzae]GMG50470.1 unnamed protein product [Aspergillus oryzae var. brunneus]
MPLLKRIKLRLTEDSFHESVNMIWVLVGQDPSDSGNMAYVGTNTERSMVTWTVRTGLGLAYAQEQKHLETQTSEEFFRVVIRYFRVEFLIIQSENLEISKAAKDGAFSYLFKGHHKLDHIKRIGTQVIHVSRLIFYLQKFGQYCIKC